MKENLSHFTIPCSPPLLQPCTGNDLRHKHEQLCSMSRRLKSLQPISMSPISHQSHNSYAPNSTRPIDSSHKLIQCTFVISRCADGFS